MRMYPHVWLVEETPGSAGGLRVQSKESVQ